jgi:hypothetical protein
MLHSRKPRKEQDQDLKEVMPVDVKLQKLLFSSRAGTPATPAIPVSLKEAEKDETDPFSLDVSMFGRLVNNEMPYKSLLKQRRMDPEIRRLLTPIHGELDDHEVIKSREDISGIGGMNLSFFCDF